MDAVLKGFAAPFAGIRVLAKNPRLLRYFAVPVLINTVFYSLGAWLFFSQLSRLVHKIGINTSTWYGDAAFWAVTLVIGAIFALVLIFTFTAIGLVVASPFLDLLSKKVDEIHLGYDPAPPGSVFKGMWLIAAGQAKKIILFIFIQALLMLVQFIPGVGQIIGTPVQLAATFFFLAWGIWDFPLDRRVMDYRAKRKFMIAHWWDALAFGAVCGLYMMVPVLSFFMMPASVAGATLLVSELLKEPRGGNLNGP